MTLPTSTDVTTAVPGTTGSVNRADLLRDVLLALAASTVDKAAAQFSAPVTAPVGTASTHLVTKAQLDAVTVAGGGGGGSLTLSDEGSTLGVITRLDVKGAGVTATVVSGVGTVTVSFDSMAPTTTKGDLIVDDGVVARRFPVGPDGAVPLADSSQQLGIRWSLLNAVQVSETFVPASYSPTAPTADGHYRGIDGTLASLLSRVTALENAVVLAGGGFVGGGGGGGGGGGTDALVLDDGTSLLVLDDGTSDILI